MACILTEPTYNVMLRVNTKVSRWMLDRVYYNYSAPTCQVRTCTCTTTYMQPICLPFLLPYPNDTPPFILLDKIVIVPLIVEHML